ncbi:hypothetical protein H072_3242 [Dactylellina haptotyla CBS 200.50]|uniref:Protein HGH1 homolog n=1 Tax=Dactylellina haptotyla (strain CBS 200.50) TaxID=1284197 RepID=S8AID9_DACHA|nr:hypothetical protein H072_3242 [Dactylellina haptotyla CBS 200.50]
MAQPSPIEEARAPFLDLVGFLASPRQEIRMIACGNLVGYSAGPQNSIFKTSNLKPIKDLKILVRDHAPISTSAVNILINVSDDRAVLELLATDDAFLELLLSLITDPSYPAADYIAMLLANMAKHESVPGKLLRLKRDKPKTEWKVSNSERAMDQLMDLFVKGSDKSLNKEANFDYLAYLFADIAGHPEGRTHFTKAQEYDGVIPITKLIVFTEHQSLIRRKGVASTIKNSLFDVPSHQILMSEVSVNILPYLLLPLMGPEDYPDEESLDMPSEVQFLPANKKRESDNTVVAAHLESLMLLTATREIRAKLRELQVYPIIREVHLAVEDDEIREICERLVNVLQRDEEEPKRIQEIEDDEDGEIVDLV